MKNLTFKNFKFHEDMSEETPCFSGDLYEDGKKVAYVKNSGRGGCNDVRPLEGKKYDSIAHLTDMDIDCDIMQLAENTNFTKKNQGKCFVLKIGNNFYTQKYQRPITKLKKSVNYNSWLDVKLKGFKKEGYEVLNTNL